MNKLIVPLETSVFFTAFHLCTHVGAILILCLLPWLGYFTCLCLFSVITSFLWILGMHIFRWFPFSITEIHWNNFEWGIVTRDHQFFSAQLLGDSWVTPSVAVLNFKKAQAKGVRSVILFKDALNASTFRQLRVRLLLN